MIFMLVLISLFIALSGVGIFSIDRNKISSLNLDVIKVSKYIEKNQVKKFTKQDEDFISKTPFLMASVDEEYNSKKSKLFFEGKEIKLPNKKTDYSPVKRFLRYESIPNTDFFKKRLIDIGITGQPISGDDQIVLGKSFADEINDPNLIGKNVEVDFGVVGINKKTLKVVGINNSKNSEGFFTSYISKNILSKSAQKNNYVEFRVLYDDKQIDESITKQKFPKEIIGNEKMVLGSNTDNPNSLIISTGLFQLWKNKNVDIDLNTLFHISYWDSTNINLALTGVFESNNPEIKVNKSTLVFLKDQFIKRKILYVNPYGNFSKIYEYYRFKDISNPPLYDIENNYSDYLEEHTEFTKNPFSNVLLIIGYVFISINLLLFIILPIVLARLKKRDLAIMKILGAKLWQIFIYNIGSLLFIFLLILGLTIVSASIMVTVIYNIYVTSNNIIISYGNVILSILIAWGLFFTLGMLFFGISSFITHLASYKKLLISS